MSSKKEKKELTADEILLRNMPESVRDLHKSAKKEKRKADRKAWKEKHLEDFK